MGRRVGEQSTGRVLGRDLCGERPSQQPLLRAVRLRDGVRRALRVPGQLAPGEPDPGGQEVVIVHRHQPDRPDPADLRVELAHLSAGEVERADPQDPFAVGEVVGQGALADPDLGRDRPHRDRLEPALENQARDPVDDVVGAAVRVHGDRHGPSRPRPGARPLRSSTAPRSAGARERRFQNDRTFDHSGNSSPDADGRSARRSPRAWTSTPPRLRP